MYVWIEWLKRVHWVDGPMEEVREANAFRTVCGIPMNRDRQRIVINMSEPVEAIACRICQQKK